MFTRYQCNELYLYNSSHRSVILTSWQQIAQVSLAGARSLHLIAAAWLEGRDWSLSRLKLMACPADLYCKNSKLIPVVGFAKLNYMRPKKFFCPIRPQSTGKNYRWPWCFIGFNGDGVKSLFKILGTKMVQSVSTCFLVTSPVLQVLAVTGNSFLFLFLHWVLSDGPSWLADSSVVDFCLCSFCDLLFTSTRDKVARKNSPVDGGLRLHVSSTSKETNCSVCFIMCSANPCHVTFAVHTKVRK